MKTHSQNLSIHELFEEQAARTPSAIALCFSETQLTYAELNRRANQLAHYLRLEGVGPDVLVGICLERSVEMVVAVLGILKAGGAYLPLDASYPVERLMVMVEDARPLLVLSQQSFVSKLPVPGDAIVCLDTDWETISQHGEENPSSGVSADNLAYVIYTSGSTGKPKGVLISHSAVAHHAFAIIERYSLTGDDRVLQFASLSFDVAVEEMFPSWTCGASVILRTEHALNSYGAFLKFLEEQEITVVNLPTPFWNELMAELARNRERYGEFALRLAAIGGEKGLVEGFEFTKQVMGERLRLMNVYGPTETTVTNTAYEFKSAQELKGVASVPIGSAIASSQIYILDERWEQVPAGMAGEVYIGGDSLARGFLHQPDLTAERFIPDPFGGRDGARLYRSGDLGRFVLDGNVEFLGRADHQVKVRGFRIELGEIEAVLAQDESVREVLVLAREDVPGDKRLVAYIVPEHGKTVATGELRSRLKAKLPEYMLPQAFVMLEGLPLTSNGKIDRPALPVPTYERAENEKDFLAPRTQLEELLAGIWAEVLRVERVSVHDDFFDSGGHSLLATQLLSRVRDAFQVELNLRDVFEGANVAQLAHRIEAELRDGQPSRMSMQSVKRDGRALALSFAQQRLWFLNQLEPHSTFYNLPVEISFKGTLDASILERVLDKIIERHEALRTTFVSLDEQPVQLIAATGSVNLACTDLQHLTSVEQQAELRRLSDEQTNTPFDLTQGPLFRLKLLRLAATEHVLLLTIHHIISDGWSIGVLTREIAALYAAYLKDEPSPLAELTIQYADFAHWQREWLQGDVLDSQLSYWRRQLAGATLVLELPSDRPRPAIQSYRGELKSLELSGELTERLKELSRESGATLYMLLLAAFNVLLHRYTGQEDILVGSPIANRNRAEIESLIGFFVNTLVLRTDLSGDPTFAELLQRVRESAVEAFVNQDVPFEKLVEELQPERDLSRHPLFQVAFALQSAPVSHLESPGLSLELLPDEDRTARFDLTLFMEEREKGVVGSLVYNTDLFDDETATRMLRHMQRLLESIAVNPQRRVSELPFLTEPERNQLLVEWNDTATDFPKDRAIHELFEEQAARTPSAIALRFSETQLTYAELNRRANQLAHYLRLEGVGPDVLVGICLERSVEMVVAVLGILKAGGAYLPLDASYPMERLMVMVEDARPLLVLSQERLSPVLSQHVAELLCLDSDWDDLFARQSTENLINQNVVDDLAYVIYTSGSTGHPKGACVSHRAVNRLVLNTDYVQLQADDRVAQASNSSFDAATFEIWGALLNGAQLVGVTKEVALSPQEFAAQLHDNRITTLFLTTALFNQLAGEAPRAFASLRHLLFGGEAVDPRWVREVLENGAPERLLHVYGPTETTTFATWHPVGEVQDGAKTIPIGRPLANTQLYVLDERLEPVPVGVAGQLYIGGDGLARGYLHRPELTAERFIPHPYSEVAGARLYQTGDLVRYLVDGSIEFIGRNDSQVKIRGFRIELGEIETVLEQHSAVRETLVVVCEETPGDKRLVAYYAAEPDAAPAAVELRGFLKQRLPDYMLPAAFVPLDSFPLTPNGKIDRRALPAPEWNLLASQESGQIALPRTPAEELILAIWAEVLGLEITQLGIHDNFFECGGHSLLATQVISRIRRLLQIDLPVRSLFQSPTVALLAEWVDAAKRAGQSVQSLPRQVVERNEHGLALSFAQQRLWFLSQLEPDNPFYNVPLAMRLDGVLDETALEHSFNEVVRRHEVLRTTFVSVDGQPVQMIAPEARVIVGLTELQHLSGAALDAEMRRLLKDEAEAPFDLGTGPLLRVRLLRLAQDEHVLLLTMHHIISDGWSLGILVREVAALYKAFVNNESSPLPDLTMQYADFAHWQREWLQGGVLEEQLSYWKRQLAGATGVLEMPTDRQRPTVQSHRGETITFEVSKRLTEQLKELSRKSGATLYMTLLAAFNLLLSRHSRQEDILIGSPIANRNHTEVEDLVGCFVNTLVLRTDLSGDPTFTELLGRVREVALEAYANQDVPFEKLVEEMQPERDLSRHPLFQVAFTLQNAPMSRMDLPQLRLSLLEDEDTTSKFDFNLLMEETERGIDGIFTYSTDLFDAATMERLRSHLITLLQAVVTNPAQRLSELPLLTAEEQRQLLFEWNDTVTDYPREQSIHELFEQEARRSPESLAVRFGDEQLSYAQLNARANKVAHHLRSLGVGPEVLVGLCMERSLEMVVGVLGILKAGGAYLPLDPAYPWERLSYMLEDAQTPVLLVQEHLIEKLPAHWGQVVCIDADWEEFEAHSDENPSHAGSAAENLAYVIYTSGSTGQPKGVSVTHRSVVRLVKETNYASFDAQEVFLQLAPISFDASTFEIWGALLNGAKLVVMPGQTPSLSELGAALRDYEVTTLWLTAGLFHLMVEEQPEDLKGLRQLLAGGDVLSASHVGRVLREVGPSTTLVNGYGPTESTTFACCYAMTNAYHPGASIPIGHPISNTQVYLLDRAMRPVPAGAYGELYIGGDGLARGYLNQPGLTAEKFVPHPYGAQPGARLYRTGDLARYLSDGTIEFLGRLDNQVKIRGFRIELGEIEAALMGHTAVQDAVVVAREDEPGDKRLVAYLVGSHELSQAIDGLRSMASSKLPDYMVPAAFVVLDALPLNPNGKVDRRALPAPNWTQASTESHALAARTPTEELLAGIWAEVLGVNINQLSDDADFFELGGHSLLATLVISRIRDIFHVELPLKTIFHAPTISRLAESVESRLRAGTSVKTLPMQMVSRDQELPLSFAQQRLWFLNQLEPDSPFYNVPTALRMTGHLYPAALEQVFNEIVRRHEALRTMFVNLDGQPVQSVAPALNVNMQVTHLTHLHEEEREAEVMRLASEEARTPFDLAHDPPLRVKLLELAQDEHVLLLTMHHIISDGWSMGILVREMATLYNAFVNGMPSPLAELTIQYADFAHWQREWLQGDVLEEQLSYWRKQLAGTAGVLELPTDHARPPIQSYRGAIASFELPVELSERLKQMSREQGVTLYMLLLAAFNVLLSRLCRQEDILIGSPIANRNHAEIEGLIGFFVNALLLRTNLKGDPTFTELLGRVREAALEAYANQDVPFEKLVEELQPERDLSRHPLFQVIFVLQNASAERFNLPGLKLKTLPIDNQTAMFDLTLVMEEGPEGLSGFVQYSTDLFDASTITRLQGYFQTLLESVVANPEQHLSAVPLLTAAEQRQLLEWNNTRADYRDDPRLRHLFEQMADEGGFDETAPATDRAIARTQVYVLNRNLEPVPIGIPGELYIGCISAARSSFNQPELSAEKFIPHPFSAEPGARLYKTGEVARYLPDGRVELFGAVERPVVASSELAGTQPERTQTAPRTPAEELLVGIWSEVLGLDSSQINVQDNFFELGGHSLLAMKVISRIRKLFHVELPVRSLFQSSTVAGLAELIDDRLRAGVGAQALPMEMVSRDEALPLSFAQQRLWFLNQLEPDSPFYNVPAVIRLTGSLNVSALEQVFNEIVRRHEALRTTFVSVNGKPVQVISPSLFVKLQMVELQHLAEDEQETEMKRLVEDEVKAPFDLGVGPLLRLRLLRLAATEHVLLLTMHHIISDGWSIGILTREIAALYQAFVKDESSPLPDLTMQYADFAHWQREWLQGDVLEEQLSYWRKQLAGATSVLELPTDRPRPAMQSYRGAIASFELPVELSERLKEMSREQGVTLYMLLLAAFNLLLSRHSGQEDILVGSLIANRNRAEIESLIGFFVNTLVLRTDLSGDPTFTELLGRVREVALEAYANQDVPFEKLVEEMQPERDLSRHPLFQVSFALQNAPASQLELSGVTAEILSYEQASARWDLYLEAVEAGEKLNCTFEYSTDLFDAETIHRLIENYLSVLAAVVSNAKQRLSEISLLTEKERQRLLFGWNETKVDYSQHDCLHDLFEEQAARTPDAVALIFEGRQLSYRELDERANQLANHLRREGIGPEVLVGLCVERSLEMVVGLLGVLKAGGAYVPLDPGYPQERLSFMLEDAQVPLILAQEHLRQALPAGSAKVLCLDSDWQSIARESVERGARQVSADNAAYMIYTSGSTGRPKGVINTHGAICNRLLWMQDAYGLTADDSVLQKTPFSFDVSVWEFFWPLMAGARLVMAQPGGHRDGAYLVRLIEEQQITVMHFVPSMLQVFLNQPGLERCASLRAVMCSGEALPFELQERFLASLSAELHNLYGPTEAAVDVTYWACASESELRVVPIGRPIANTEIYLLDQHLQPVPVGVPGELHIGGVSLARGYLHRPELTAEKFIPDPFSSKPGERLYKTGDSARYLASGAIEFLGRMDGQVKLRGFRVELGEIEATLNTHSAVRESVVMVREDLPGDQRLVAYYVAGSEQAPPVSELRDHLKKRLPDYMVPSDYLALDALPLTPSGKLDRRALPAPLGLRPELSATYLMPQTDVEQTIAACWRDVLQLDKVGVNDNFFDLGGHSLLVVQVQARLKEVFPEVTVIDLFRYPTINALAKYLGREQFDKQDGKHEHLAARTARRAGIQHETEIAVVGMSGRFPQARNLEQFWRNLRDGVESISKFSEAELEKACVDPALLKNPDYIRAGAILEDVERFDAAFFGFSPREAEMMDPQQRLFLECAWEALEHAGYNSENEEQRIGVFAGASPNTYLTNNILAHPEAAKEADTMQVQIGNARDHLPTLTSYKLNLKGPSLNVQTACSTSLVAVHLACQSLLNGECDMALAGGVSIGVPQQSGYLYEAGGIYSPDGHCRAFDAKAEGTVGGSGVGIVLLKRLADALADADTIHAVIKGSAINNDGSLKVSYTAPSVEGEARAIIDAQAVGHVKPETVTYVETHGTGTPLGDPIELAALAQAFGEDAERPNSCAIGSIKMNIGHLDAAAGIAGLIKTVLALKHKQLPPSLHFEQPNPKIDFASTPFYVNTKLAEWKNNGANPRRAGVSSFGIGGTNAHVVLEEAPLSEATQDSRSWKLLVLSGKTRAALEQATVNLFEHLRAAPELNLADVAYTLQVGRRAFAHRRAIVCRDLNDALASLETRNPARVLESRHAPERSSVIFMFPGQGTQYVNMGKELYACEPIFRAEVERCAELLRPHLGFDLRDVLYPAEEEMRTATQRLTQTAIAQPALFVVEYALAKLWMERGLRPSAMIGHSIGEYVAACLSGVISLADALTLVALRGRLMQELPGGVMLVVPLSQEQVQPLLGEELCLASINAPSLCVVSGTAKAVENLRLRLADRGVDCQQLHTSHAFHSQMMEPAVKPFAEAVKRVALNVPQIPYFSNVTGNWISATEATDPNYWSQHLRQTVRFAEAVQELLKEPERVFVEVGPGRTLCTLLNQQANGHGERLVTIASLRHAQDRDSDMEFLMKATGRLWLAGIRIDWSGLNADERRQRLPLPTYPFERQPFWIEPKGRTSYVAFNRATTIQKQDIGEWLYIPSWKRTAWPQSRRAAAVSQKSRRLLLVNADEFGARLVRQLRQEAGDALIVVQSGSGFAKLSDGAYVINPAMREDYDLLFGELGTLNLLPDSIFHLLGVTSNEHRAAGFTSTEELKDTNFYSLLFLAQSLAGLQGASPVRIEVVSNQTQRVLGSEVISPEKALAVGLSKVISQEYTAVTCQNIDIVLPAPESEPERKLISQLMTEVSANSAGLCVAYRGGQRWVQVYERIESEQATETGSPLKEGGIYLLVGGLGSIGYVMAEHLAQAARAKLILVSRLAMPARDEWANWLESHAEDDKVSLNIRKAQALEKKGGQVFIFSADVADEEQMRQVVEQATEQCGEIDGVIHAAVTPHEASFYSIEETTRESCEEQFKAKVRGLFVLEKALKGRKPDFCLLFSSLSSVLGGLGFASYAAANSFMDAFAHNLNRAHDVVVWKSINWDGWNFGDDDGRTSSMMPLAELAITPDEGIEIFKRALSVEAEAQLIVSTGDLQARIDRYLTKPGAAAREQPSDGQFVSLHPRPEVPSLYVAPRNELEQKVAEIWQELLGIERVGAHDNFFELGGHSLLATRVNSRLRDLLQVHVPLQRFFDAPTLAELTEEILARLVEQEDSRAMEQLLGEIEQFSEDNIMLPQNRPEQIELPE